MNLPNWAKRLGPYGVSALITTAVDFWIYVVLLSYWSPLLANLASWSVAVIVSYFLHALISFQVKPSWKAFAGYVAVCVSTLLIGTAVLFVATAFITPIAAKAAAIVIVFAVSFAISHSTVFRTV